LLLAFSFPAQAQQQAKVPQIGFLSESKGSASNAEAFVQGLRKLGYVEGKNISIETRNTMGKPERIPGLAAELVRLKVDVIFAPGTAVALGAKKATQTIPIVFASVSDAVGSGLVASLPRPGGNITGLTQISPDLAGKRLEILTGGGSSEAFACGRSYRPFRRGIGAVFKRNENCSASVERSTATGRGR